MTAGQAAAELFVGLPTQVILVPNEQNNYNRPAQERKRKLLGAVEVRLRLVVVAALGTARPDQALVSG